VGLVDETDRALEEATVSKKNPKRLIKELDENEVVLEIGEGYVRLGVTVKFEAIQALRTLELSPAYARDVAKRLLRYADVAEGIAEVIAEPSRSETDAPPKLSG
jgi:hypothetical protein